jgi:hypothetical protein
VLEDGSFGNPEAHGDVPDAGGVISVLGEMLSGGLNDPSALGLRSGAGWSLPLVQRRRYPIAGDSWHK